MPRPEQIFRISFSDFTATPELIYNFLSDIAAGKRVSRTSREMDSNEFSQATERVRCNRQMVLKEDSRDQEEVYGTISDEEWNKMVEEALRRDKKLLEKLAKI